MSSVIESVETFGCRVARRDADSLSFYWGFAFIFGLELAFLINLVLMWIPIPRLKMPHFQKIKLKLKSSIFEDIFFKIRAVETPRSGCGSSNLNVMDLFGPGCATAAGVAGR